MFVSSNRFSDIKTYFFDRLKEKFSTSELRLMLKELTLIRFEVSEIEYVTFGESRLSESDLLYYRSAVKRLLNDEPFQYILGTTWFYDLQLNTDHRALIPRPETEELVHWVKEEVQNEQAVILDLCSGSGCIALALKSVLPKSHVVAAEYSDEALQLIKENSAKTDLDVSIIKMDVLSVESYQDFDAESVDFIVSNPPYIPVKDKALMHTNVLDHEPHMALFVEDEDPLLFYREISKNSLKILKPGGSLFFEIHEDLSEGMEDLLKSLGFINIVMRKDLQGKPRMMKAQKVSSQHESSGS